MTIKQFKTLFILLIAIFSTSAQTNASDEKTISQYWQETGLNAQDLKHFFSTKICYSDQDAFLGCIAGLNALAGAHTPPFILKAGTGYKSIFLGHPEREPDLRKLTKTQIIQHYKKTKTDWRTHWLKAYQATKTKKVNFDFFRIWAKNHILKPSIEAELTAFAINSYLKTTNDPHTHISPLQFRRDQNALKPKSFAGIGVTLSKTAGVSGILVNSVRPESTAEKMGIVAGDLITKVDGAATLKWTIEQAVKKIRGEPGTMVHVSVKRGTIALEFEIQRASLSNDNVSAKMLNTPLKNSAIGYIKLDDFSMQGTCTRFLDAVQAKVKAGARAFIVDLRNNPGGSVSQAICVASAFLPPASNVVEFRALYKDYEEEDGMQPTGSDQPLTDLPVVVLIDAGSASAAEILAGALRDHKRAVLVGDRTFGKGTVQDIKKFSLNDKVSLTETKFYFFLPSGRTNQIYGVSPDILTYRTPDPKDDDKTFQREEDLFVNYLPPLGGHEAPHWAELAQIQQCNSEFGVAAQTFRNALKSALIEPDYQLGVALDVSECLIDAHKSATF